MGSSRGRGEFGAGGIHVAIAIVVRVRWLLMPSFCWIDLADFGTEELFDSEQFTVPRWKECEV